jgi:membrane fusion protein (multidrug efflux system)
MESSSTGTSSAVPGADAPVDRPRFAWFWSERVIGIVVFLLAAAVLIVCVQNWNRWIGAVRHQRTDDAYLTTDLTPLSARVSGYVRAVPVQDFQTVRRGQLLVQIDDDDYRAAAAQAAANVAVAEAAVANLEAEQGLQRSNIMAAGATVAASLATSRRADRAATRQHVLLAGGAGSEDQVEAADAQATVTAADLDRDHANRGAATERMKVLASQVNQARASVAAARAAARIADINLRHTRILAPGDGVVGQRQVHPGQFLAIGGQVLAFAPLPRIWVIANFKETQMAHVFVGQRTRVTIDAFPDRVFSGRVVGYAPASGAQFSLLPPDNATGNFTKIVQRIAVKITLDVDSGTLARLRPGMSANAVIDTGIR